MNIEIKNVISSHEGNMQATVKRACATCANLGHHGKVMFQNRQKMPAHQKFIWIEKLKRQKLPSQERVPQPTTSLNEGKCASQFLSNSRSKKAMHNNPSNLKVKILKQKSLNPRFIQYEKDNKINMIPIIIFFYIP